MTELLMLIIQDRNIILLLLGLAIGCLATWLITYIFKAIDHAMGVGPRKKGGWGR